MTPQEPRNVRIVHADGSVTPVEVEFLGTEPREAHGDIFIVDRWQVTTDTFVTEGDRLMGDFDPDRCFSVIYRRVLHR